VISVTSNVAPAQLEAVVRAFHSGDLAKARALHFALLPLHDAMFVESNPGPVKAGLHAMGILRPEVRLPLVWPSEASVAKVRAELERQGLLASR
jgi:4-hydroxy-tetrahydrodipicolinate synthase